MEVLTETEIGQVASNIINRFGRERMAKLIGHLADLLETWNEEFDYQDQEELNNIRLVRTAYMLSKISELYGKDFSRITKKHPQFFQKCDATLEEYESHCSGLSGDKSKSIPV